MHTISMLRRTLGLSSDNQVRNRIERIKDLLAAHIRRGPNNQIFLTDPGLDLVKRFQELYDTGLTLTEANHVLRATMHADTTPAPIVSSRYGTNGTKPDQSGLDLPSALRDEMALIRRHVAAIERQLPSLRDDETSSADSQPWWSYLREDVDVTYCPCTEKQPTGRGRRPNRPIGGIGCSVECRQHYSDRSDGDQ